MRMTLLLHPDRQTESQTDRQRVKRRIQANAKPLSSSNNTLKINPPFPFWLILALTFFFLILLVTVPFFIDLLPLLFVLFPPFPSSIFFCLSVDSVGPALISSQQHGDLCFLSLPSPCIIGMAYFSPSKSCQGTLGAEGLREQCTELQSLCKYRVEFEIHSPSQLIKL